MTPPLHYDAIVIGAGPAGGVAALMLARAGWHVAIVEKSAFPRRKVCGEYLSATNLPLFAELGLLDRITASAGPEIRRMGFYAQNATLTAPMPHAPSGWGRALGREVLDTLLLGAATAAGAHAHQPCTLTAHRREGGRHICTLARHHTRSEITATHLIDAHGSWDQSAPHRPPHRPSDMLGFKAHFRGAALPPDLMPLLVFEGGYGGLVTTDDHRVTFGCCLRRDTLDRARARHPGPAAQAVQAYVTAHCTGVAKVLAHATQDGPFLATGPLRPGIRPRYAAGVFHVGNAAGEVHPLVGEGMSMAMQAAWLLATALIQAGPAAAPDPIGRAYAKTWFRRFAPRVAAATIFAHLAMRRTPVSLLLPLLTRLPALLTYSAARSGKTQMVVRAPARQQAQQA